MASRTPVGGHQQLAYVAALQGAVWRPVRVEGRKWGLARGAGHLPAADWLAYVHPGDRPRLLDLRAHRARNIGPYHWRYRLLDASGGTRVVHDRGLTTSLRGSRRAVGALRGGELPSPETSSAADLAGGRADSRATAQEIAMRVFAHDVSGPLHSAANLLGCLGGTAVDDAFGREALLGRLSTELARVQRLVDEVFSLDRLAPTFASNGLGHVDVTAVAASAVAELEDPRVVHLPSAPVWLAVDRVLVKRALVNLIGNALRYAESRVTVSAHRTAYGGVLAVEDDGVGVEADMREAIFEPFIRLDAEGSGGLGLGLSLVRRVAEMHGGLAWVEDGTQGGARFVLWLTDRVHAEGHVEPASPPAAASLADVLRATVAPLTVLADEPTAVPSSPG